MLCCFEARSGEIDALAESVDKIIANLIKTILAHSAGDWSIDFKIEMCVFEVFGEKIGDILPVLDQLSLIHAMLLLKDGSQIFGAHFCPGRYDNCAVADATACDADTLN